MRSPTGMENPEAPCRNDLWQAVDRVAGCKRRSIGFGASKRISGNGSVSENDR